MLFDNDFTIKYQQTDELEKANVLAIHMDSNHAQPEDTFEVTVSVKPEVNTVLKSKPFTSAFVCETVTQNIIYFHCTLWPTIHPNG